MPVLATKLNPRSDEFKANAAAMRALVDDLNAQAGAASRRAAARRRAPSTRARGKLLPRDRVELLLDPGTPFLELAPLAALRHVHDGGDAAPARADRRHRPRQRASSA